MHTQLWRDLAAYIESLTLCQGRKAGQPFLLESWQRRFLRGAFSVAGDCGLSVARGSGKTTFSAGIMAATLDGPLAQPYAESVLVASSLRRARYHSNTCWPF